jgi:hypothetical protein
MSLDAEPATVPFALRRDEGKAKWIPQQSDLIKSTGTAMDGRPGRRLEAELF